MTKAIGYIRVSTDKQSEKGFSLGAQREKLEAYSKLYDIDLVRIIVDTESAKSLDRKGLQEALEALSSGEAESLLVAKLDRLTRSVADLGVLVADYFKDCSLLSVAEQIDTRSAAGRLVLNVLGSVSQWEREAIGERTSAAMQHMKAQGQYTGGHVPYGFKLLQGELVKNEAEQAVIQLVRKYKAKGMSLRAIAETLANKGLQARTGKQFHPQQVSNMVAA